MMRSMPLSGKLIKQGKKEGFTSLEAVVADAASGGKSSGWRSSEYSRTKTNEMDYHEHPAWWKESIENCKWWRCCLYR